MTLGTYIPSDVTFLLKPVEMATTDVTQKEKMIQSGQAHYSEMISEERRPDARYLDLFNQARKTGDARIARDIVALGNLIEHEIAAKTLTAPVVLCSLVRAGLPYGVMLKRELDARGIEVYHYGVSIIRDKGLDKNAMSYILNTHGASGVVFVDGWTGKGAISKELTKSWQELAQRTPKLAVVADPAGYATLSGSHEDWLIPSGILGANISGLISRTILNKSLINDTDYHGTMRVDHLADIDMSRPFVDDICALANTLRDSVPYVPMDERLHAQLRQQSKDCVAKICELYDVQNTNRIKPGIAEATRAVLRRKPEKVFVRSAQGDNDLSALLHLCQQDGVDVVESPDLTGTYRAITLIGKAI